MKKTYRHQILCPQCGKVFIFNFTPREEKGYIDRYCYGKKLLIQEIFPNRTPAERELLRGGICGNCWDELFNNEDEYEDEDVD